MCIVFEVDVPRCALPKPLDISATQSAKITQLTDAMNELRSKSEDLKCRITSAELAGEKPTHQVEDWLAKVASINAKITRIQTDHQNGPFCWCINSHGRQSLAQVITLSENLSGLDVVTAMGSYFSHIQDFLRDEKALILGIWGMGGVGKTTILGSLNNDLLCSSGTGQTPPMLDHILLAVVSKDYKVKKLQSSLAEWLCLPLYEANKVKQAKAKKMRAFLKNKKGNLHTYHTKHVYLLLDDLWTSVDLAEIGIPQSIRYGRTKQMVVFTTWLEDICAEMKAAQKIKVECLNEAESWQLFADKMLGRRLTKGMLKFQKTSF